MMNPKTKIITRFFSTRRTWVIGVGVVALVVVIFFFCRLNRNTQIPIGEYGAKKSQERMIVDTDNVRIIRGKSTLYLLPNKTNTRVYANDDLAKSKPQRLYLWGNDKVEWIREATGPSPEYKMIFVR